ncbi:hypothetical protein B0A58_13700 [Flavobacterium branchiophilum NBRC 15030 = ATCC 35035]|uniref:Outer membrane protein beta-barrel domain-containing protein n=1 Tax=Flavobacterium branchiophilum TaxID=55197 RepID=A0A543G749_9FLAO|nr:hypothetical protein [Flavobacterium branchiophilum]OXA71537.1 hypothetical protein B0A58_13700 [Flavobacterium branchiophilum NBRC 15030 = ATCC 35035]TQM41913.1 hypothetical protein BC670_2927 [Flavobacterium branchiophilum]GEM55393.1 hypothetical protein FB1_16140 [Flavobacterium branchiophilum NBRC 15030 = ATCC 35035]
MQKQQSKLKKNFARIYSSQKIIILISILNSLFATAQSRYETNESYKIFVGINIVDDSYTKTNKAFNIDEEWNMATYPSYFGFNMHVIDDFSAESVVTFNQYKSGKLVNGKYINKAMEYFAIDVMAKYEFRTFYEPLFEIHNFSPFLVTGLGMSTINNKIYTNLNYGFGFYFWFRDDYTDCNCGSSFGLTKFVKNLGIVAQTIGKSNLNGSSEGNHIQHTIGLAYRF